MATMPYQTGLGTEPVHGAVGEVNAGWQHTLPILIGKRVVLREVRASDAASLSAILTADEVSRFISPPPATVEGFERFIDWMLRKRAAGVYVFFAVTLQGFDAAIGIFQICRLDPSSGTAEWGFAIGSAFWGTGVFQEGANLVLQFVFDTIGARRLQARALVQNGRGNGALVKIGAVQEALLRKSFLCGGRHHDQMLYAILARDWRAARSATELPLRPHAH